jgi:FkbM family methyltransferase
VIDALWRLAAGREDTLRLADLTYGQLKMRCDLSEVLQRQFYFFGTYFLEEELLNCWETAARGARVVLDVGANAGIYSLAALAVQGDATVHAFEPTPEIAAHLRETASLNQLDGLHVHQVAVLRENGVAALKRCRGGLGTNGGMNFVVTGPGDSDTEPVQTVCLDQFCEDQAINDIDLLKVDVQGHEYSVLSGAEHLIQSGRIKVIFVELNWAQTDGVPCAATECIRLLESADYRFSRPGRQLEWRRAGDWVRSLSDVVARRVNCQ